MQRIHTLWRSTRRRYMHVFGSLYFPKHVFSRTRVSIPVNSSYSIYVGLPFSRIGNSFTRFCTRVPYFRYNTFYIQNICIRAATDPGTSPHVRSRFEEDSETRQGSVQIQPIPRDTTLVPWRQVFRTFAQKPHSIFGKMPLRHRHADRGWLGHAVLASAFRHISSCVNVCQYYAYESTSKPHVLITVTVRYGPHSPHQ